MNGIYEFVCTDYSGKSHDTDYYKKFLCDYEFNKISKAVEKRKLEFLYGRLCAKLAYSRLTGKNAFDSGMCIKSDRNGAPFTDDGARFVSITHDGNLAAAIVTNKEKLYAGLDVQKTSLKNTDVIFKFINEHEKSLFKDCTPTFGSDFTASAMWVAKEAMSKLLGYGFGVYDALEIESIEKSNNVLVDFKNFKGFKVVLRSYRDYIFGFAAREKDADLFTEDKLIIEVTEIDQILQNS